MSLDGMSMKIITKRPRMNSIYTGILVAIACLVGCSPPPTAPAEIIQGSTKDDVIALYGEPNRTQEFIIPDEPFFGPQEGLINLVPPGTTIEEWVYDIGDEELYIWFSREEDATRDEWRVLDLGRYPKGAVY
jgi:hypothetical protein